MSGSVRLLVFFFVNSLVYAIAFLLVRRIYRHFVPLPITGDSLCSQCGYDLTGNKSGTCPECGMKVEL